MASFILGSTLPKAPVKIKTFNSQTTEILLKTKSLLMGLLLFSRKILSLGFDYTNHPFFLLKKLQKHDILRKKII